MSNDKKPTNNGKGLATIKAAPSMAAFEAAEVENAIRAGLPNGARLSTDQVRAAALAARSADLNPFTRELYVTDVGVMKAAAADAAWAHEWMRAMGEREPEFSYVTAGQLKREELIEWVRKFSREIADDADMVTAFATFCDALNYNPSTDVAVLVRMYRFSTRDAWTRNVQAALLLGTRDEVRAIYGLAPKPDHEAWGIVRMSEYKEKKDNRGNVTQSARDAWIEAGSKYNHLERAKKRGRTACYRATVPVNSSQIARLREGQRTTTVVKQETRIDGAPTIATPPPMPGDNEMPRFDILDGDAREVATELADAIDDAESIADALVGDDDEEPTSEETIDAPEADEDGTPSYVVPMNVQQSAREIETAASNYAANGRTTSEKQDKLIGMHLDRLCAKDDALRHDLLRALTGHQHYGDLPGHVRLALLNNWIKLTDNPAGGYPQPCKRAADDVAAMKTARRG